MGNPEVRRIVEQCVQENLTEYLELHPDILDSILLKSLNALKVHSLCNQDPGCHVYFGKFLIGRIGKKTFLILFISVARSPSQELIDCGSDAVYDIFFLCCRLHWQPSGLES